VRTFVNLGWSSLFNTPLRGLAKVGHSGILGATQTGVSPLHTFICDTNINKHHTLANLQVSFDGKKKSRDVLCDLVFDRYYCSQTGFCLEFRIKSTYVEIELEGCEVKGQTFEIGPDFEIISDVELETKILGSGSESASSTLDLSSEMEIGENLKSTSGFSLGYRDESSSVKGREHTTRKRESRENASRGGSGSKFQFSFDTPPLHDALRGHVKPRRWFTIKIGKQSARLTAQLKVMPDDVAIWGKGGIWPQELPPRKRRLLRALALSQLDFKPFLSKCEVRLILDAPAEGAPDESDAEETSVVERSMGEGVK
jgi:hypothetical protein